MGMIEQLSTHGLSQNGYCSSCHHFNIPDEMNKKKQPTTRQRGGGIIKGSYSPFIEFVSKPHLTTQLPRWGRETGKPKKSVYVAGYLVNPTKWELRSEDGGETG